MALEDKRLMADVLERMVDLAPVPTEKHKRGTARVKVDVWMSKKTQESLKRAAGKWNLTYWRLIEEILEVAAVESKDIDLELGHKNFLTKHRLITVRIGANPYRLLEDFIERRHKGLRGPRMTMPILVSMIVREWALENCKP